MQIRPLSQRYFSIPDLIILLLIATAIYGIISVGYEWQADFQPLTQIDLSMWSLPRYTLLSAFRGIVAYVISLGFTLTVGYWAAKSKRAESIIIPLLDIFQSIPVLGFLPGLVLGLIALFPRTNTGLELAAILMIFLGQVWNMTFSYYSSLKSIPTDFIEASTVMGLSRRQRLFRVELPFSAVNLAWNSLMSMAGGWFFLGIAEAFSLGETEFRLPGIGAYMAVAIREGNHSAMLSGVVAMITLIIFMDFLIWRPILAWVQRFRLEEVPGAIPSEPLMQVIIRESRILRWISLLYRRYLHGYLIEDRQSAPPPEEEDALMDFSKALDPHYAAKTMRLRLKKVLRSKRFLRSTEFILIFSIVAGLIYGSWRLFQVFAVISPATWVMLLRNTFWTFLRVILALALSTLWAVPAGIWIGLSPKRVRIAQPIIQVLASFPMPMVYPLVLASMFRLGIGFDWGSMFLMLLGVQWYILFNVLAGALRVSRELKYALDLMKVPRWDQWKTLYLPSVFPALVTGWVTAVGGAWNASIVAEYTSFEGAILKTGGIGSTISAAAENKDFPLLAASLFLMVVVVLSINRFAWSRLYHMAQTRFRMDL